MAKHKKHYKFPSIRALLFSLLFIATCMWGALTLHISRQLEQQLHLTIAEQQQNLHTSIYPELLEYKNSLFNGYVLFRLRARGDQLDDALSGLAFKTRLEHGPLIIDDKRIQVGFARLTTTVDRTSSSEESNEWLERLFDEQQPLVLQTLINSERVYQYSLQTAALEYRVADIVLRLTAGSAAGTYTADSESIPVELLFDRFELTQGGTKVNAANNLFEFDACSMQEAKITMPGLELLSEQLKSPILAGSSIKLKREGDDAILAGIRSQLTTRKADGQISNSTLSLNLANIQLDTVFALLDQYEEQHSLEQQIQWTLDFAADSQEGQDHLIALFQRQEETVLPRADDMISYLLTDESGNSSFVLGTNNLEQDSYIQAEFAYNGLRPSISLDK